MTAPTDGLSGSTRNAVYPGEPEGMLRIQPALLASERFKSPVQNNPSATLRALGVIIAFALLNVMMLQAQTGSPSPIYGYPTGTSYSAKAFSNYGGETPVVDFGLYQRPYDALQNQPIASLACPNGSGGWSPYTGFSATAPGPWQAVLSGRTDEVWSPACAEIQLIVNIPLGSNGGQILISQTTYNSVAMQALSVTVGTASSSACASLTSFGTTQTATFSAATWDLMSISAPAAANNCMEIIIQDTTSGGSMNLTSIKYLTISPTANYNNNQPFLTDYYQNMWLGAPYPAPQGTASEFSARLLVQGATADNTSEALWVTNVNGGTTSGNTLFFVRDDGAVAINSKTPSTCGSVVCNLTVNGPVATSEVIVTSGISADYVFKPGYALEPLSEVSRFIQKEHHLPGIPSEAEVKRDGVNLGEMQAKLLAKIEELTLHLIEQQEANKELKARVERLELHQNHPAE